MDCKECKSAMMLVKQRDSKTGNIKTYECEKCNVKENLETKYDLSKQKLDSWGHKGWEIKGGTK